MDILHTNKSVEDLINNNKMVLLYFGSKTCGVCTIMKSRIEKMLEKYPEIRGVYIDVEKYREIAVSYSFFTVPGILLFVDGKESIREAGYINLREMDKSISRYYSFLLE